MDEEYAKQATLWDELSKTWDENSAHGSLIPQWWSSTEAFKQEESKFENLFEDSHKSNGYKTKASEFKPYIQMVIKEHEEYYERCLIDMNPK